MPRQKYHVPQMITYKQADGTLNVFIRNEELGRGSFSIVYRVIHQNTNKIYAMKVISKKRYYKSKAALEDLKNEIKIQKMVHHPNIVSLSYSFTDGHYQYFILEYCPGRTIREYLNRSLNYRLKEPEIRKILKDVIQGLVYIHGQGITHYDIKLENFVIDSSGNIKIGDFGLSSFQKEERGKRFSIFGTYNYLSPEMVARRSREDTSKVDIWAVGVSAFFMLTGKQPFEGRTSENTFHNILRGEFRFPLNLQISREAKDFVRSILQIDPSKRPLARELLEHPFLTKVDSEEVCLYGKSGLPALNDRKAVLPGQQAVVLKDSLYHPFNDNKAVSPRPIAFNLRQPLGPPINEKKAASPRPPTFNLGQPIGGKRLMSSRQPENNARAPLYKPLNDNKQASPMIQNDGPRQSLCPPLGDNKAASPRPLTFNLKQPLCPPLGGKRPMSSRQPDHIEKPSSCPPLTDSKSPSPRPPSSTIKPPLCPPLNDKRPMSSRQPDHIEKPPLCPPLTDRKSPSPKPPSSGAKVSLCPPLNDKRPMSSRQPDHTEKPPLCDVIQIQHDSNQRQAFCPPPGGSKPVNVSSTSFVIPHHFVSRYIFFNDDLCYLLLDGTVGICFRDKTRIVMDPDELFAQFYKDAGTTYPDIIDLDKIDDEKVPDKIMLLFKAAIHFKKIRFSYELPESEYEQCVILHNIKRFVKNEDSILFELDDMNFQMNFNDNTKLIIFWNMKKLCFIRSLREKCALLDLNGLSNMNPNSDELKKFKNAKILLSDLSLTIC